MIIYIFGEDEKIDLVVEIVLSVTELKQSIKKLATVVESDPKAPFSIATTSRCWEGRDSFS